jgi:sugar-specific transcriptional regulator TrmB
VSADRALELLKSAGMPGYEAKAYLALLTAAQPMNGYEVAKVSGVPRSTVYETLGKLVARGAVFEVASTNGGVAYVALPADALIGRLRRESGELIESLETVLPAVGRNVDTRVVQHLVGRDDLLRRSIDVIESAAATVWMSIWPSEATAFVAAVNSALTRGVDVSIIAYGDVGELGGRVFTHHYSSPDVVLELLQCRISVVVADHDQVVFGGVSGDDVWGMWSDDPAVALVAAEHVRHDIALQVMAGRLEEAGLADFWATDPDLERIRAASARSVRASRPA